MKIADNTPTRTRSIGGTRTVEGIDYEVPRPWLPEHFATAVKELGVSAEGCANGMNQLLAENLTNNFGSRIKTIREFNEKLEDAQDAGNRLDEEPRPFPTQTDLDEYIANYDYSGAREASPSETSARTIYEREIWKLAKQTIRNLLKSAGKKIMPKGEPATEADEVTWAVFEAYAGEIVNREGVWGDETKLKDGVPVYFNKCEELHAVAKKAEAAAQTEGSALASIFN